MHNRSDQHIEKCFLNIRLEPGIPSELLARLARVAKTVERSSGDEELIYVAWEYALITFEMAVRLRYEEITHKSSKELNLKKVIERCAEQGLFEEDPWRVDLFRNFRNDFAHTKMDYKLGGGMRELIFEVVDNINDLYEDPAQRAERRRTLADTNALLRDLISQGAVLEYDESSKPIFKAEVVYQRQRSGERIYHLLCWPMFELSPDNSGNIDEGKPLILSTDKIDRLDSGITCRTIGLNPIGVTVEKIVDSREASEAISWISAFRDMDSGLVAIVEYEWRAALSSMNMEKG